MALLRKTGSRPRGFTLLEMLLAIVIISAMVVAVAFILIRGMEAYTLVVDRREALQEARTAVNMMTNELQTIQDPSTGIAGISATSITFTPAAGGSVTYSVSGGNLLRGAKTLASSVSAATQFQYFTAGGASTSNPAQVYRIHIAVEVDTPAGSGHGKATINSNVYLRNRYFNAFQQI